MAISPPGDIVLDVTRAADPAATALARARLEGKAGVASAEVAFEAAGDAPVAAPRLDGESASKGAVPKSYVKFEGMVLQTFLQSMMPNDTESVYGGGMSGDMWKSLLSQTLGETMAERGGIGIASHLMNDHYVENGKKVPLRGVDDSAGKKRPTHRICCLPPSSTNFSAARHNRSTDRKWPAGAMPPNRHDNAFEVPECMI